MRMNKTLIWVMLFAFVAVFATQGFADSRDLTYKSIEELSDVLIKNTAPEDDEVLVYDDSTENVKKMTLGSLLSNRTGASSMASSSTVMAPSDLPYTILRKYIGGNSGLDETGDGTNLPDGKAGQVIVLLAMEVDTNGSWVVTPDTSVAIDYLTFDAQGETTTLLFVDSTTGWVVVGNYGTTVTINKQTGIPSRP